MKETLKWILGILIALCAAVALIWGGEIATISRGERIRARQQKNRKGTEPAGPERVRFLNTK